ncbi:MAG: PEP-CTERM sorting domain-containing protein [Pseudomonadota bacterium]
MKSIFTLSALALASLMSVNAQAVSWSLSGESVTGTRLGVASLNDVGDAAFGPIDSDLAEVIPTTSVYMAGFDGFTAVQGGNSIDVAMSHSAVAESSYLGDTSTAYLELLTSASLDNAFIVDANVALDAAATAPVRYLSQSFTLMADAGESVGMQALVTIGLYADHEEESTPGIMASAFSSYQVFLNGNLLDADSFTGFGSVNGEFQFDALIGDTITLQAVNESAFSASGLMLNPGDAPHALVDGEFRASLQVAAVPEPEAYALMLAGLGLVGLAVRRKQNTAR